MNTEQERAEFEAWVRATKQPKNGWWCRQLPDGGYSAGNVDAAWEAWQAAHRTQVGLQGWKLVPEDATQAMVRAVDKVNMANADTDGTAHNIWNVMLAAAPQPPEAAPVKLPEPIGVLRVFDEPHEGAGVVCMEATINAANLSHGWHTLYTEHQVRQLLDALTNTLRK